jgi:hypothetical protein
MVMSLRIRAETIVTADDGLPIFLLPKEVVEGTSTVEGDLDSAVEDARRSTVEDVPGSTVEAIVTATGARQVFCVNGVVFSLRRRLSGRWKSGNPGFGFPLSHRP